MINVARIREVIDLHPLIKGAMVTTFEDGSICYCGVGALLHAIGYPRDDLAEVEAMTANWKRAVAALKQEYGLSESQVKRLIAANDGPVVDYEPDAAIRARVNTLLDNWELTNNA